MPPSVLRGRVVGDGEPAWTEADRDEAVALVLEDWDTCRGCGQRLSESTHPDGEGAYTVEQLLCGGCQVREAVGEEKGYRGRLLHVKRKPVIGR